MISLPSGTNIWERCRCDGLAARLRPGRAVPTAKIGKLLALARTITGAQWASEKSIFRLGLADVRDWALRCLRRTDRPGRELFSPSCSLLTFTL